MDEANQSVNLSDTPAKPVVPQEENTQTPSEQSGENGENQTSNDQNGGTGGSSEGENQGGESKDDINPDTGKPFTAEEWKAKFVHSSQGVNKLLDEKRTLEAERDQEKAKIATLEKEIADLRTLAEGKNPEGLNIRDLQEKLSKAETTLATLNEKTILDDFERAEPLAAGKRDALRALAKANPDTPLQKLWDDYLKAGAVAEDAERKKRESDRKNGQGDSGKGTSTKEPGKGSEELGGYTFAEFNKLPLKERQKILNKSLVRTSETSL